MNTIWETQNRRAKRVRLAPYCLTERTAYKRKLFNSPVEKSTRVLFLSKPQAWHIIKSGFAAFAYHHAEGVYIITRQRVFPAA